jgi:hypothetical protein
MTGKTAISIAAFVSSNERAAVEWAAEHLARALGQVSGDSWTCNCAFRPTLDALLQGDAAIVITSFLPELERIDQPWSEVEQRLRTTYAVLGQRGAPVFICTILRHIDGKEDVAALLIRIRRLNLLAAEISHLHGAYVIDLDRVIANIGARRLRTDYRLDGSDAAVAAGHFIALTLVENAVDAFVPFEVQDAVKANLELCRPAIAVPDSGKLEVTLRKNVVSLGRGRRKQIVAPVSHLVEENHAGWLTREVLRGAIGPREALKRLLLALRRRGVRESTGLLVAGLSSQINRKK